MGRLEDISISRFRWRAAAVAARRCKKLHARACWAPRGALPLSFSVNFLILSGTGPPDLPLTARGGRLVFLLALLPNVLPSFRFTSVPCESPGTPLAIRCRPRRGHNWSSYCTRPTATRSNYIHVHFFYENSFLFILFLFLCFSSELSHFALDTRKTIRPRKQEQLPCNAPAIVCFAHARTPSAAVMPNRAQGALSFILSACIWRSPQSPVRACTAPLMLPPAGLLSPPLIRSTFAEITTTDAIFARPSSIYCIQYTFA